MTKKAESKEQKTIEGTADEVTGRVKAQATLYARMVRERMALQDDEAIAKPALEQMMGEDRIEKLEVVFQHRGKDSRSEVVRSEIAASAKVTCKKLDGEG